MKCYIKNLYTENEEGDVKESGVKYIIGTKGMPPDLLAQDYCDKPSLTFDNFDSNDLDKWLEEWKTMESLEQDIILFDKNEVVYDLETIKTLKEIAEYKNIKIIICKDFNGKRNSIVQEATYYDGMLPDIDEGIGLLFNTTYPENVLVNKILGRDESHENVLYLINFDGTKIQNYYSKLMNRCTEIDAVMRFSKMLYTTSPKTIFCFESTESYKNFRSGFDKLTDTEEIVKWKLAYGSDSNKVLNMSVFVDLGWQGERMIFDENNKIVVWANDEIGTYYKDIDPNIIFVKNDDHKSEYDCFMKIKDKAIEIDFPQFDTKPVLFEVENDEIVFFINQIYGMICKSQVIGLDISEIADCFSKIKSGKFITELISKQDTEQVAKAFRSKLHKGRAGVMFRVEGDVTLSESTEIAEIILDETSNEDVMDAFSVTYESDNYQDTKRISMWY